MKVIVLGKDGMLGRYVYTYLSSKYNVIGTTRKELDAFNFNKKLLRPPNFRKGDVVINCVGLIKQRPGITKAEYIAVNSLFPHLIADYCSGHGIKFIHITTDCVFDGKDGSYTEVSPHNASDLYGLSKSMGEPDNALVVRTSIIGEELCNKVSLIEWVKANAGKSINGYTNHFWNGITCLQFAKLCEAIIENNIIWSGVHHIFSPDTLSKYELVQLISDVFDLNVLLAACGTPEHCDRSLSTIHPLLFKNPTIKEQLIDLKNYTQCLVKQE